jgi:hypothetical protein
LAHSFGSWKPNIQSFSLWWERQRGWHHISKRVCRRNPVMRQEARNQGKVSLALFITTRSCKDKASSINVFRGWCSQTTHLSPTSYRFYSLLILPSWGPSMWALVDRLKPLPNQSKSESRIPAKRKKKQNSMYIPCILIVWEILLTPTTNLKHARWLTQGQWHSLAYKLSNGEESL